MTEYKKPKRDLTFEETIIDFIEITKPKEEKKSLSTF